MTPLVSVCIVSFNHQAYIRECLDSVLSQETDFPFEVIVGDDCSTDDTREIIDGYATAYPSQLIVLAHAARMGATPNMMAVHNRACGQFIAHLDGDDCMLPGKLQQQVNFLRRHPDHSIVAHDVEIIDGSSRIIAPGFGEAGIPVSADLDYLVATGCYFVHSSKMHRRSAVRTTRRSRLTVDFFFHIEQALSGRLGYIDRPLGRYRRTDGGISSPASPMQAQVLQGHLDAYAYALQVGVRPEVVYPALLNFRYVNIMLCLRAGRREQVEMLRGGITKEEMRFSTARQRMLFRSPAWMVGVSARLFDSAVGRSRR